MQASKNGNPWSSSEFSMLLMEVLVQLSTNFLHLLLNDAIESIL